MSCCVELDRLLDQDLALNAPMHKLTGRILTEIDTEFFLVFGSIDRPDFVGMNYCPFCGRVLSRGLWNLEKKKG